MTRLIFLFTILLSSCSCGRVDDDIQLANNNSSVCNRLPRECKYVDYGQYYTINEEKVDAKFDDILCENKFNDERMLRELETLLRGCVRLQESLETIVIKPSSSRRQAEIVNEQSFRGLFRLPVYGFDQLESLQLTFLQVNGFDIESRIEIGRLTWSLSFYTQLNLYKQNKRIANGCDDFRGSNSRGFVFQQADSSFQLDFHVTKLKSRSKNPLICSLFFRNARLRLVSFDNLVQSFYFRNTLSFIDANDAYYINSSVFLFEVSTGYGLDIDEKLINRAIFNQTIQLTFTCHLNSIATDVFKPFTEMRHIRFRADYLMRVIRRQGIEWIKSINSDVSVRGLKNLSNNRARIVGINLFTFLDFFLNTRIQFAYDEDFCLFVEFPFRQLVFVGSNHFGLTKFFYRNETRHSCTLLWLFQFYRNVNRFVIIYDDFELAKLDASNFTACRFEARLELCKKQNFHVNSSQLKSPKYSLFDFFLLAELLLVISNPLVSVFGMVTNLLVIYVIYHKNNKKLTREKHYIYMSLHCACNTLICCIAIVSLVNECQYPIGFYCSSIRSLVAVQYVKIVLGEYVTSVCRLVSNFTYLAFSLCRLSKVGKDHGQLIVFANELAIKKYMAVAVLVSLGLSVCKALQFDINLDHPEYAYPLAFSQSPLQYQWMMNARTIAITVVNSVYDLINYFGFVVVHLAVDMVLIKKLKRVLREKEAKMREIHRGEEASLERCARENDESKRRVFSMVMLSSALNLVTKVPSAITSLNDVRLLIQRSHTNENNFNDLFMFVFNSIPTSVTFRFFCSMEKSCLILQSFGEFLFLISLATIYFFLKCFDMNFKFACHQTFPPKIYKNETNR